MTKVSIVPDNGATVEVLASEISRISAGIKALRAGPLTERTLLLLIQRAAPNPGGNTRGYYKPLSIIAIRRVLAGLEGLEAEYVKKPKAR